MGFVDEGRGRQGLSAQDSGICQSDQIRDFQALLERAAIDSTGGDLAPY